MAWLTMISSILTLAGVSWTVYRTDARGKLDRTEARHKDFWEKRQQAYVDYARVIDKYRFAIGEVRKNNRLVKEGKEAEATTPIYDFTTVARELIEAEAALDIYGTSAARQAAHDARQVMLSGDFLHDDAHDVNIYEQAQFFLDVARKDIGADDVQ